MTAIDPLNPSQVAFEIARLTELLEETTYQYREDIREAAQESAKFKGSYARAMLVVIAGNRKLTVAEKEAMTEVEVNDDRIIAEVIEAKAKATKASLDSIRVQVDALRSLGANLRVQV